MRERQQNSTAHPLNFLVVLAADHISPATGKTLTVTISKDGGAFATPAGAVSEIGNGWYSLAGNATDRNTLGSFLLNATAAGCDPCDRDYTVVGYDPFDAQRLGLTALPATGTLLVKPAVTLAQADVTGKIPATVAAGDSVDAASVKTTIGTAGAGLTNLGDARLGHLDADVSSRSAYAGGDTAGTTTLLGRLTSTRAGNLDNLDAAISTRSTYAGGDTAGTTTLLGRIGGAITISGGKVAATVAAGDSADAAAILTAIGSAPAMPANFSALSISSGGVVDADMVSGTGGTGGTITGTVDANVISWLGHAVVTPAANGIPSVDVVTVNGKSVARNDGTLAGATATTITFVSDDPNLAGTLTGLEIALYDQATNARQVTTIGAVTTGATYAVSPNLSHYSGTYDYNLGQPAVVASGGGGSGSDTSGTTTLLSLLTPTRAGYLDRLDVNVSSRGTSNFAGGAVASVTAPVTVGTLPNPAPTGYGGSGGGSDPWATALPGSYSSGTAGQILASRGTSNYAGGAVASVTAPITVGTITDKAGYSLASTGLNAIAGVKGWNFPQMLRALAAFVTLRRSGVPAAGSAGTVTFTDQTSGDQGTVTVDAAGDITANNMTPAA